MCIEAAREHGGYDMERQEINFDGKTPDRDQRLLRLGASVLSLASVGLGLMWALVDEEHLTWHDHISKTFPSVG